jgi:predicted nucleic acid-binding protein
VGRPLILETTFLIDLEREHDRGVSGPALTFLESNQEARLYLSFVVAGELAAGTSMRERTKWTKVASMPHAHCAHDGHVLR